MKNLRMFEIKYLGPTNSRGSRLKITDTRFGKSVTLSKHYAFDDILSQAIVFLEEKGINVVSRTWNDKTKVDYLMTEDFQTQIK